MGLRVLAISAPQFAQGQAGSMALTSAEPASLENACRYAASLASDGHSVWADSNWNSPRRTRRDSILLLHDMTHAEKVLAEVLPTLRPNLVLIGAMSICMPGAICTAKIVRDFLGDNALIVLGGRHACETVYEVAGEVRHHQASPLRLMASGRIEPVFDVVIAGDGEMAIPEIGSAVARALSRGSSARSARLDLEALARAPGNWIAGTVIGDAIHTVQGRAGPIDYAHMPSPAEMFGVGGSFSTFGSKPTAHVFSDTGRGCIHNCDWCSERLDVVGRPRDPRNSADRLFRNLKAAGEVIRADGGTGASAFCEDSVLLGWNPHWIDRFCSLVAERGLDISFGGQTTIDQILVKPQLVGRLRNAGLEYIFVGVESPFPDKVGGFQKDMGRHGGSWLDRGTQAFEILAAAGVKVGISLLFGLGEAAADRDVLFKSIERWNTICELDTISMNWAVKHPLKNLIPGRSYEYLDWAIEPGALLDVLRNFGEASTRYTIDGQPPPTLTEAQDIVAAVASIAAARKQVPKHGDYHVVARTSHSG